MFDKIYVVTHPAHLNSIKSMIDARIGLIELSDNYTLRVMRKPISNKSKIVPAKIFDTFRKDEYLKALRLANKEVPNVPNTQIFRECKKIFSNLKPTLAHDIMINILSERMNKNDLINTRDKIPR